jgi:hypothetical protein
MKMMIEIDTEGLNFPEIDSSIVRAMVRNRLIEAAVVMEGALIRKSRETEQAHENNEFFFDDELFAFLDKIKI